MSATQAIPSSHRTPVASASDAFASIARSALHRSVRFIAMIAEVIRESRALEAQYRDRGHYRGFKND
jgi:hypothetical protein